MALLAVNPSVVQAVTHGAENGGSRETVLQRIDEAIPRWSRVISRVQDQLTDPGLSHEVLEKLRDTVVGLQSKLSSMRPALEREVDHIRKLIEALGAPPKESEPPESSKIVLQREKLKAQFAEADGQLKQLNLLLEKYHRILTTISSAEDIALADRLIERTPSLFAKETWIRSAKEAKTLGEQAAREMSQWYNSRQVQVATSSGYLEMALAAVIIATMLSWFLRRWLIKRFGRKPEIANPTYRMRVRAVLAETTARTAIPFIVTMAAYATLRAGGFLFGFSQQIAIGLVMAVVTLSVFYGLPRSMLSPSRPQWRLAPLKDATARLWYRCAVTLAVIAALDVMLIIPANELSPSQNLQTTYNFVIDFSYALLFLYIAIDKRLWRTSEQEEAAQSSGTAATTTEPVSRSMWLFVVRSIIILAAIAIPVTALAGYGVLSNFIARRLLATVAVFLIAIVFHGIARDLVAVFTQSHDRYGKRSEGVSSLYIWSVLFLDIGLVLTMAFLIVPLWGGQWGNILERLGWSLTGFKIGGHVFSITNVLAGMAAFIIVLALVRFMQRFLNRRILQHMGLDSGVRDSLTTAIGYIGLVIAALIAVTTAGIDLSGLVIVAGALSVGVGFGLQSIVNNFVSGLILLAERPIKVGDWVHVGVHEGIVQRISVRSTEIKTFSRASVIVPNSELISTSVVNWMHGDRQGRIELQVGVAYGSDVEKVREILLQCAAEHEAVSQAPEPHVLFMDFGDSALAFELRCFVADVGRRLRTTSELRFAIDKAFRDAGISIPFPQRDLHIKDAGGLAQLVSARTIPQRKSRSKRPASRKGSAKSGMTRDKDTL
jgi:small-conductance mechanosensitive channel